MDIKDRIREALVNDMGYTQAELIEKVPNGDGKSEYYYIVNHRAYGRYEVKVVPGSIGDYMVYRESDEADSYQGSIEVALLY